MTFFRRERKVYRMLALSRKKNEAIIISNNVEVTILEVKGDQVKVGSLRRRKFRSTEKKFTVRFRKPTGRP